MELIITGTCSLILAIFSGKNACQKIIRGVKEVRAAKK